MPADALPIHEALPRLKAALADHTAAVLVAPPGAGKTTVVPLKLLEEAWVQGRKLIVLEPRRLAARAAAARMASSLSEPLGGVVGYRVRLDSRVSARTRIEVVTEGVFTRMILEDPSLEGVAAVLFDEFHERSLEGDLGLAFARETQEVLRPDLRLIVMSATLEVAPVAALLGGAPVIESRGRQFDVVTRYLGRGVSREDQAARAVLGALAEQAGGVLVFLPGQSEIRRVVERLLARIGDPAVDILPLYGALDAADQDRAIAPSPPGRRKVVLATDIAQTSLTLEDVRVVIDGGQARVPRYDPASGLTRLATVRVSRASADQRRGRAGRTGPGVCLRLWDEAETRALPAFDRPEILQTDLSRLALDLARWGTEDVASLAFLDPPPPTGMAEARSLLERLGALTPGGALTAHGRAMSRLPLPPRLAHLVLLGARSGQALRAARIAAVLTERGLGGRRSDLSFRLAHFAADRGPRARAAAALAERWAALAGAPGSGVVLEDGLLVAAAFPERIAKNRGEVGAFQLAGGRGAFLDPDDPLAPETWLAVAELGGGAARDRILLAARLGKAALTAAFGAVMTTADRLEWSAAGVPRAIRSLRLGHILVAERPVAHPDAELIVKALLDEVRRGGLEILTWGPKSRSLRARAAFLGVEDLSDPALMDRLGEWLASRLSGGASLACLDDPALEAALGELIPWDLRRRLDGEAPERWIAPTGSRFFIDYAAEGGPRVDVRVQELFGLAVHPTVGGGRPLTLALLSPAHRPIQLTQDLPGFWAGSWREVRKEMRGRYPKHPWPEDPAAAAPTRRAKPRG